MELDLQSLIGLHVHSCTHWMRPWYAAIPNSASTHLNESLSIYTWAISINQEVLYSCLDSANYFILFEEPWTFTLGRNDPLNKFKRPRNCRVTTYWLIPSMTHFSLINLNFQHTAFSHKMKKEKKTASTLNITPFSLRNPLYSLARVRYLFSDVV
jgi:hypothetical protein